jgi:hypothetical protein
MAKKEDEIKLTKDNARLIPQIINIDEDCTMTVVDNDLNNVGTVVVKGKKMSLYTDEGNVTDFKDFDELIQHMNDNDLSFYKFIDGNHRWHEYNPNPKKKNIGDCSLRAYCAAFGWTWEEAFEKSSEIAKNEALMMDTHKTCEKVMASEGYVIDEEFKKSKRKDLTVNEFALTHPYGTYFLNTHGHLLCVKDGEYWDSWDSGKKKVRRIYIKKAS